MLPLPLPVTVLVRDGRSCTGEAWPERLGGDTRSSRQLRGKIGLEKFHCSLLTLLQLLHVWWQRRRSFTIAVGRVLGELGVQLLPCTVLQINATECKSQKQDEEGSVDACQAQG